MSMLMRYSFKPLFADFALALSKSATSVLRHTPAIPSLGKVFTSFWLFLATFSWLLG